MSLSSDDRRDVPEVPLWRVEGCLVGGAVGDSLGAAVEFLSLSEIRARLGPEGVCEPLPAYGHAAAITDDTQMTLFTAEGLIRAHRRATDRGICHVPSVVQAAYRRWLVTQGDPVPGELFPGGRPDGWLVGVRELHTRRAPGATCLSALRQESLGSPDTPLNDSKGCGAVMRAAPIGLSPLDDPFTAGCEIGAITHGHPTGYLASGALALLIRRLAHGATLPDAADLVLGRLSEERAADELIDALHAANAAAREGPGRAETVERLGAGWVAEEALSIALYCALAAPDSRTALLLAVNHSGDSDSTGAICGNIVGALRGADAIPARWREELELREVIEQVARDLHDDGYVARGEIHDERDFARYPTH